MRSLPAEAVEFPVPHAAEKGMPLSGVNVRTGPPEFLLLRTPISPPGRLATSTQLPLA